MSQLWDIKIRKLLTPRKMHILRYLGSEFCEMSTGTFAISHKISNLYTEKCALTDFYVCIWFTKSLNYDVISLSETVPWSGWHHALHTPSAFVAFVRGIHDDVIRWKYFRVTGPLWGESTGHQWIPITKVNDAELWCFFFICTWTNGWTNNWGASDFTRRRVHYDVTVMTQVIREMQAYLSS